jgi:hypothetical protein
MNLGIFSSVVKGKIQEIIDDIEKAANEFSKGNRVPITTYAPLGNKKWQKNLQEFDAITRIKPVAPVKMTIEK